MAIGARLSERFWDWNYPLILRPKANRMLYGSFLANANSYMVTEIPWN